MTYDSLVHEVGRERAKEIQRKLPGLFSKTGLGIDVLAEAADMDLRGLVQLLEDWTGDGQKSPLPLLAVNTDILNALVDRIGLEKTREYLTQRKRYLTNLRKGLQSEYDSDKTNEQKRKDLEETYTELREIDSSIKALDTTLKDPEAAKARAEEQEERRAIQDEGKDEEKERAAQPETVTLEEAMKRGYDMADSDKVRWNRMQAIRKKLADYDLKKRRQETLDRRAELEEYLKANPEAVDSINPQDLKYLGVTTLNKMTIEDVRKLAAEIGEMYEQGKREYIEWEAARQERIDKINAGLRRTLNKAPVNLPIVKKDAEDLKKQYDGIRGGLERLKDWGYAATLGANRFFDWLDGGAAKYDGPFVKQFVDTVNKARDAELRHVFERRNWMQTRLRNLGLNMGDFSKILVRDVYGKDYTVDEVMEIYAGMLNEKKKAAILFGVFGDKEITDPQVVVDDLISRLSDAERQAADLVIQDHDRNVDRIEGAFIGAFNHGFDREESYSSIHRLEFGSPQGMIDANSAKALIEGTADAGFLAHIEDGFTIKRVVISDKNQKGIQLGLFSNWHDDVSVHEHSAAFASFARETAGALMGHDPVEKNTIGRMIKERFGDEAWNTLVDFFNIAVRDDTRMAHSVLNVTAAFMAKNMSISYLAGNLATVLKQTTSIPRFLTTAGPHRLLAAIGEFAIKPNKFLEEIYEMDPQMRDRAGSELLRAIRQDPRWGRRGYQKALRIAMAPISIMDRWVAAIGWKATYYANLKNLGKEKAIREAQRAVALTQQTAHAKDSPAIWRQNGYVRLVMTFTSDAAQTFGMTVYDLAQQARTKQGRKAMATFLALSMTAIATKAMADWLSGADEDDEGETDWGDWTLGALTEQAISSIPLIGKEGMVLYDSLSGNYRGTQYSAIITPIERLARAAKIMTKEELEEDDGWKVSGYALEALSLSGLPFPYTAMRRAARSMVYINDYDPLGAALTLVGKRTPRRD
jgi:hypothetical protein